MINRMIPSSGEMLPVVGMGSWIQFDVGDHSPERNDLKEVLKLMHQHQATVIDSSPMYGKSEQAIGSLAHEVGLAEKFFYATKVWTSGQKAGVKQMNESMQKMRRPVMDLIQVHNLVDWQTHLDTLRAWKAEGKVRYTGITHYTVSSHADLEKIIRKEPVDFVQFNYSIATRNAERRLLPLAKDRGVAVIINEPLEKGSLFDRVKNKSLPVWATELGIRSWSAYFLKYIISHPAVTCVIPASSNPDHMKQNLESGEGDLPNEAMRKKMVELFENF